LPWIPNFQRSRASGSWLWSVAAWHRCVLFDTRSWLIGLWFPCWQLLQANRGRGTRHGDFFLTQKRLWRRTSNSSECSVHTRQSLCHVLDLCLPVISNLSRPEDNSKEKRHEQHVCFTIGLRESPTNRPPLWLFCTRYLVSYPAVVCATLCLRTSTTVVGSCGT
jgi:hypothetical protein